MPDTTVPEVLDLTVTGAYICAVISMLNDHDVISVNDAGDGSFYITPGLPLATWDVPDWLNDALRGVLGRD